MLWLTREVVELAVSRTVVAVRFLEWNAGKSELSITIVNVIMPRRAIVLVPVLPPMLQALFLGYCIVPRNVQKAVVLVMNFRGGHRSHLRAL